MRALVLIGTFMTISACAAPLAQMDPLGANGRDVQYRNGLPIVLSRGARFDVFASPVGGATGAHPVDRVVTMVIGIRNRSGERIDVSERNLTASAAGRAARVMSAATAEDSLRPAAEVAEAVAAVQAAMQDFETTAAFGPPERPVDARSRIRTATLFQRNSVEPGAGYVGAIGIEREHLEAPEGSSRIAVFLLVDDEVHTFDFNEVPQHRFASNDDR